VVAELVPVLTETHKVEPVADLRRRDQR
jgi:hypothetical protein